MLKCRDVAHEASDYLDHNMSGWRRFWFRLHLFICHKCRVFLSHVDITRAFLNQRGAEPAASDDVDKVMAAVARSRAED